MTACTGSFSNETKTFINNHKLLCGLSLGLAIIGYCLGNLAGRTVAWLRQCCGSSKKTDNVSRPVINQAPPQPKTQDLAGKISPSNPLPPAASKTADLAPTPPAAIPTPTPAAGPDSPKPVNIPPKSSVAVPPAPTPTPQQAITPPPPAAPPPAPPAAAQVPAPKPSAPKLSLQALWDKLKDLTSKQSVTCLKPSQVHHLLKDIVCPKQTAIQVQGNYIHANTVVHECSSMNFVASQAPQQKDLNVFWRAIFNKKYSIVDLTTLDDLNNGVTQYYPDPINPVVEYGDLIVRLTKIVGNYSHYEITEKGSRKTKEVVRYHYNNWKDFGAVSVPLLDELVSVLTKIESNDCDRIWVHCRAGVGRTGTLITAFYLLNFIVTDKNFTKANLDAKLVELIASLRAMRGPWFVQQPVQLDLLRQYGEFLLSKYP